ncbi:MAG: dockerin type I repeat-containing protein [Phycisphaerales bacterium]|nr:MAG: dockerin type I repeat-containing protein [Phycisphaerales bacterium]
MTTITTYRPKHRRADLTYWLWLLCASAVAFTTEAAPPIDPLPIPDYSFSGDSWTVSAGLVDAGDVLTLDFPYPAELLDRETLGLHSTDDDLDALSAGNTLIAPNETFVLLFSVDAQTVGVALPDPALIALDVPYNVADQAAKGQAAGDQFMSTRLLTRMGSSDGDLFNNVLVRNNFDEGGTDFSAQPPTSAWEFAGTEQQDDVNATAALARVDGTVMNVYYSVTQDSPSLSTLPHDGGPSGADIYFDEIPPIWTPITLCAMHEDMGLVQEDDLDALIIFDTNASTYFDESDQVLFSLAPGSPSLATIPGASSEGAAADVFTVTPGGTPSVFVSAADLGLGHPDDNINALDLFACDDAMVCAAQHGIRYLRGDLNSDGVVDLADYSIFADCLAGPNTDVEPPCQQADLDADNDVDLVDFIEFTEAFTGP